MRKLITILMVVLPMLIAAQIGYLPFIGEDGTFTGSNSADRGWRINYLLVEDWNDTEYVNNEKTIIVYDPNHETAPQQINNYFWNLTEWVQNANINYIYDDDSGLIIQAEHNGITGGNPTPNHKYSYTYDGNHLSGIYMFQYRSATSDWGAYKRMHFIYSEGYLTSTVEWRNNFGNFAYDRYDYTYGTDHKVATKTRLYCTDSLNWVTTNQEVYSYHANDYTTNNGFLNFFAHTYPITYPLQQSDIPGFSTYGMPLQITNSYWIGGNWMTLDRDTYSYNNNNRPTEFLEEINAGSWTNDQRWTMSYDTNSNPEYQTFQDWEDSAWVNQYRIAYFWTATSPADDQTAPAASDLRLNVYPSPFQTQFKVNLTAKMSGPVSLKLFNTKGQCVVKQMSQPNNSILMNTFELPSGIYLLKATQGNLTTTQKLIKIK